MQGSPVLHHPAFLPSVSVAISRPSTSSICKRRVVLINNRKTVTSKASPSPNHETPSKNSNDKKSPLAKAACIAAVASMLAMSAPSFDHLNQQTPILHPLSAYATGRGGGASFTSASGDVNKDPESLLRWSLPIKNDSIRRLQQELESSVNELRGLKWNNVDSHVKKAKIVLNKQTGKILSSVPDNHKTEAKEILSRISETVQSTVEDAVSNKNADKVSNAVKGVLREVGTVEEYMVTTFPYEVPEEYSKLPQLKGRATVEMILRKGGEDQFDINGTFFKEGKLTLVLDGYSAPVSSGNFIDLVNQGFYNNIDILRSDGFIVQSGKPKDSDGFIDKSSASIRTIPLEVFAKGDKMPIYGATLEDDGRGASSTVLPFTSYGTLAVARNEFEANTASSQFFWFLFEPDLTPAGRNLMDGNWAVMGYTTNGGEYLRELQKGDQIVSAKIIDGLDNLVTSS